MLWLLRWHYEEIMKQIIPNYSFNKTNGQITFTDFAAIDLERVLLVVNVTDGVVVYQFNDPSKLASAATNVLDLAYDTSAMDNADKLLIIYDVQSGDPTYEATPVLASGAATAANQTTIIGHVDGIETLITSTNTKLDTLNTTAATPAKATDAYSIAAISDDGTYKYFWFEDASLNYYIMRKTIATSVFQYTKGTGGYASVYQSSILGPSGSPSWASYGNTF
jgi:hypothetical protein